MRVTKAIIGGLFAATYIALALRLADVLTASDLPPDDPSFDATVRAINFIVCFAVYLCTASLIDAKGVMSVLTLLIVVGPIIGALAGLAWSTLIFAFGGGFAAEPVYYGITGGTYGAAFLFLMIACSFGETGVQQTPPTTQESQSPNGFDGYATLKSAASSWVMRSRSRPQCEMTTRHQPGSIATSPFNRRSFPRFGERFEADGLPLNRQRRRALVVQNTN